MYMKATMKKIFFGAALLTSALVLAGCAKTPGGLEPAGGEAHNQGVTIVVNIPGAKTPATRSMDGLPENEVKTVDMLVFDASGSVPVLSECVAGTVSENASAGSGASTVYTAKFTAKLSPLEDAQVVIVANAAARVAAVKDGFTAGATTKSEVLEALTFSKTGAWPAADGDGNYTPVPMYGETGVMDITAGMQIDNIEMRRMLARIDIRNTDAAAVSFTLEKVHLCNYNTAGNIAPKWNPATGAILAPCTPPDLSASLPAAPAKQTGGANAITYDYTAAVSDGLAGEVYAFESPAADDADEDTRKNSTCLVLEGLYKGNKAFYRVDFTYERSGSNTNYMPLLRNYKYDVQILLADGPGYTSLDDAINSYTVLSNLKTRLIYYDMSDVRDIVFNGQYMLGVGDDAPAVSKEAQDLSLKVFTDNPNGWQATIKPHTGSWLTFASGNATESGTPGSGVADLGLKVALNPGPESRTATILLTADRLNQEVVVTQSNELGLAIRLKMTRSSNDYQFSAYYAPFGMRLFYFGARPNTWCLETDNVPAAEVIASYDAPYYNTGHINKDEPLTIVGWHNDPNVTFDDYNTDPGNYDLYDVEAALKPHPSRAGYYRPLLSDKTNMYWQKLTFVQGEVAAQPTKMRFYVASAQVTIELHNVDKIWEPGNPGTPVDPARLWLTLENQGRAADFAEAEVSYRDRGAGKPVIAGLAPDGVYDSGTKKLTARFGTFGSPGNSSYYQKPKIKVMYDNQELASYTIDDPVSMGNTYVFRINQSANMTIRIWINGWEVVDVGVDI